MTPPILTDHFSALASNYDAILSDVWGVIHNGVESFSAASEALTRFRENGGTVCLISNAPRPGAQVTHLLDHLHVPHSAYDSIVTSGDVTRDMVAQRAGEPFFLIGPERDHSIFEGLDAERGRGPPGPGRRPGGRPRESPGTLLEPPAAEERGSG